MKLHYMKNRLVQLYSQKSGITKRSLNLSLVTDLGTCTILFIHGAVTLLSIHIHWNCHPSGEIPNTKRQQCETGHSTGEMRKTCFQANYRKHEKSAKKNALFPSENFLSKTNMYLLRQTEKQTSTQTLLINQWVNFTSQQEDQKNKQTKKYDLCHFLFEIECVLLQKLSFSTWKMQVSELQCIIPCTSS